MSGTGERRDQTARLADARTDRIAAITAAGSPARDSTSRLIVGSEATGPNNSGWPRTTATSAKQSPPSAIATARFSTVSPGSCTDRRGRHRDKPRIRPTAKPLTLAVFNNIAAPADEISDSPPDSTRIREPAGIAFTYGVPFRLVDLDLRQAQLSQAGQALPCITRRTRPTHAKDRG